MVEEAEEAKVAMAEAMPEEEDLVEEVEAEAEAGAEAGAEEADGPQPLTPMTQAGATLHLSGEA